MIEDTDIMHIPITKEMLDYAKSLERTMQMNRTKASEVDTLTGLMGELIFAEYWYGNFKVGNQYENLVKNFGQPDFEGRFEVKASCFPFSMDLNLLIREDYAKKRTPPFYIQILFDTDKKEITTDTEAMIIGYKDGELAHNGELKEMRGVEGFKCYHTKFSDLDPIEDIAWVLKGGHEVY